MNLNGHSLYTESFGNFANELCGFQGRLVEIEDGLATGANEMVMRILLGIDAERAVVQAQLTKHATFDKRVKCLVDRGQRDARNKLSDPCVNFLRARVAAKRHQRIVDDCSLMSHRQTMSAAKLPEIHLLAYLHATLMTKHSGGFYLIIIIKSGLRFQDGPGRWFMMMTKFRRNGQET